MFLCSPIILTSKLTSLLSITLASMAAAIPSSTFTASKVHQSLIEDREARVKAETAPQYNSKLMNSIWGLYNRYAPSAFQKNVELGNNDCRKE